MKTKSLGWLVALGAMGCCSFVSCSEPAPACTIGLAGAGYAFAVRYTAPANLPACATAPGFTLQQGDLVGAEFYFAPNADGTSFDDTKPAKVALKSDTLTYASIAYGTLYTPPGTDANAAHLPYSLGAFTSAAPDANNMCPISGFTTAEQDFTAVAAVPADMTNMTPALPALPADTITYDWANVKVYVTAADQGTQFSGDVTISDSSSGTACAVTYHAVGLWPGVSCDDGMGNPVPALCSPCADPTAGMVAGSGISPDAQVVCKQIFPKVDPYDAQETVNGINGTHPAYWCVLDEGEPPVLNPNPPTCEATATGGSASN